MLFAERKVDGGYEYTCQDIFGEIVLESPDKLGAVELDMCAVAVIGSGARQGSLGHTLAKKAGRQVSDKALAALEAVRFRFDPAPLWEDDDEGPVLSRDARDRVHSRRQSAARSAAVRRFTTRHRRTILILATLAAVALALFMGSYAL